MTLNGIKRDMKRCFWIGVISGVASSSFAWVALGMQLAAR